MTSPMCNPPRRPMATRGSSIPPRREEVGPMEACLLGPLQGIIAKGSVRCPDRYRKVSPMAVLPKVSCCWEGLAYCETPHHTSRLQWEDGPMTPEHFMVTRVGPARRVSHRSHMTWWFVRQCRIPREVVLLRARLKLYSTESLRCVSHGVCT